MLVVNCGCLWWHSQGQFPDAPAMAVVKTSLWHKQRDETIPLAVARWPTQQWGKKRLWVNSWDSQSMRKIGVQSALGTVDFQGVALKTSPSPCDSKTSLLYSRVSTKGISMKVPFCRNLGKALDPSLAKKPRTFEVHTDDPLSLQHFIGWWTPFLHPHM